MKNSLLLTDSQVIKLCDYIIDEIYKAQKDNKNIYLCDALYIYLLFNHNFSNYKSEFTLYIPEFTFENARKYCNGRDNGLHGLEDSLDLGWWDGFKPGSIFNYKDRINFMEWIKSQHTITPKQPLIQKWLQKLINIFN